jgi:hypothetical protein
MPSLQHAAVVALQIQDAVNLSAVVLEFNEALRESLWPEAPESFRRQKSAKALTKASGAKRVWTPEWPLTMKPKGAWVSCWI